MPGEGPMAAAIACATLPLLLFRRRKLRAILIVLAAALSLSTLSGCTNIFYPLTPVAPGTYTIPITATDASSNISHTANFTLIVTQ